MIEERIVRFCAPVLSGIKTGSLFNTCGIDENVLYDEIEDARKRLNRFGIKIRLFFTNGTMPLAYVYRESALEHDLANSNTQAFLTPLGYADFDVESALSHLADRLREHDGFPHEIGLFLSYPLADVKDFVQFGSECAIMKKHWCVFNNEEQAKKCFAAYDRCHAVCLSRYREGQPLEALALVI